MSRPKERMISKIKSCPIIIVCNIIRLPQLVGNHFSQSEYNVINPGVPIHILNVRVFARGNKNFFPVMGRASSWTSPEIRPLPATELGCLGLSGASVDTAHCGFRGVAPSKHLLSHAPYFQGLLFCHNFPGGTFVTRSWALFLGFFILCADSFGPYFRAYFFATCFGPIFCHMF